MTIHYLTRILGLCSILFIGCSNTADELITGKGGKITNDGFFTEFKLKIDLPGKTKLDAAFGLKEVYIDLIHSDDSELILFLQSPDGSKVELSSVAGAGGQNYSNTCFASDAEESVKCGKAPFTGRYRPVDYLGSLNNGQNPNGTWKLLVKDWKPSSHQGKLNSWKLSFGGSAPVPVVLEASGLPLIILNTRGKDIVDSPRIMADMGIINTGKINHPTDTFNDFNGQVSIEVRGSSSQNYSKKSYAISTYTRDGKKTDASLLGMPAEKDWILYAPYPDKTLLRNYLTYNLYASLGHYSPRGKFAELIINGDYKGVYMLLEKIKRDENRVNVSRLEPDQNNDSSITGGYIFRIDRYENESQGWYSQVPSALPARKRVFFKYYYPTDSAITNIQKNYIRSYVDSFETALINNDPKYSSFIKLETFIDYFLICELSKNVDSYKLSTYLYKDRNSKDKRIGIGPVWDFDLAWNNANYGQGNEFTGWKFQQRDSIFPMPQWWEKLYSDPVFRAKTKARWTALRQSNLSNEQLYRMIDNARQTLGEAVDRNFKKWPVLGSQIGMNPEPLPKNYNGEIERLKAWIKDRGEWMDKQIAAF